MFIIRVVAFQINSYINSTYLYASAAGPVAEKFKRWSAKPITTVRFRTGPPHLPIPYHKEYTLRGTLFVLK